MMHSMGIKILSHRYKGNPQYMEWRSIYWNSTRVFQRIETQYASIGPQVLQLAHVCARDSIV